jgi:two-component system sensor histidine kinase KdpD
MAIYVEAHGGSNLSERGRQTLNRNLRLAEELGATTLTLTGNNVAEEVVAYANAHNVTKIVIGKPDQPRWKELLFGSVVDDLIRRSGQMDIYVIRGEPEEDGSASAPPRQSIQQRDWRGHAWAVGIVAAATALGWPFYHHWHVANTNVLMLYLLGVLWIATRHSRAAAVLASLLSVAAFDFCFVPPYFAFTVTDQQYIFTFAVMLVTALVIGALTVRVRAAADAARQRERRTASLLSLSRELAAARTTDAIVTATVRRVAELLGGRTILLLPDGDGRLLVRGDSSGQMTLDAKEGGVAQWAYQHAKVVGRGTSTLPASAGTFVPLRASRGSVGVIGVFVAAWDQNDGDGAWSAEQRQVAEGFASQTAMAVERTILADEARQAWERVEAEFLRNTLLSGVSHELRTPLAAITGAASALIEAGDEGLSSASRREMLDTIYSEAERMDRLINNLLDMTRLESGGLVLKKQWVAVEEVVGSTLHHLSARLRGREVRTTIAADLPLVQIDGAAVEQVLVNLLENALEYTPECMPIEIASRLEPGRMTVEVADHGPGLPPGTEKRVFEKFFRIQRGHSRRGIGLGLAICRGIIEAHGGTISAANREGGGAVFRFTLPLVGQPPAINAAG